MVYPYNNRISACNIHHGQPLTTVRITLCLPLSHFLPNAAIRASKLGARPNQDRRLTRLVPTVQLAPIRNPLRPLPALKRH